MGRKQEQVAIKDLGVIFVCFGYPEKLMAHLRNVVFVEEREKGVYQIHGERVNAYILVQSRLDRDEFLWLRNLSDCVKAEDFALMAEQAVKEPENSRKDELFRFIGENNERLWKGDFEMNKIFEEIESRGEQRGENRLANLIQFLIREQRYEDIALVSSDSGKRMEFYQRYGIL